MKKMSYLTAAIILAMSLSAFSQSDPSRKDDPQKKTAQSTMSGQEKASRIKELEAKISINKTDPTFPAGELKKQEQELAQLKKTKTTSVK